MYMYVSQSVNMRFCLKIYADILLYKIQSQNPEGGVKLEVKAVEFKGSIHMYKVQGCGVQGVTSIREQ